VRLSFFGGPTRQAEQFALDRVPVATLATAELAPAAGGWATRRNGIFNGAVENCGSPLASFAKLGVGLATLRDYLFFLGSPTLVNDLYQLSRGGQD